MKKILFTFLLVAIVSVMNINKLNAQVVNKKPKEPMAQAQRPPKPGPDYVWTGGGWKWNKKKDNYEWEEGKWEKQKEGHAWVPGDWKRDGNGYRWFPGHWKKNM